MKLKCNDIKILAWHEFTSQVMAHLTNGARLISFFSSPGSKDSIYLSLILLHQGTGLIFLRTELGHGGSFSAFTRDNPMFHCFEREIFEQSGILPIGHPWLKPVRFSGSAPGQMSSYPFFKMEGKEIHEVGVGPIHAGVIEPGHFRFMCYGETVHHLEIQLGYQHRGVASLLLERKPKALGSLVETVAGDSSVAHAWAYTLAIESLCGFQTSPLIDRIRGVALELERIAMHLAGLAGISTDIAFLPGGSTYGRLRTAIINTSMQICGSRFGRGWIRPGGVQAGIDSQRREQAIDTLLKFQRDISIMNDLFLHSTTVKHRLRGTGFLSKEAATEMGIVGLAARASSLGIDLRRDFPAAPYQTHPIPLITENAGDCWARTLVRIREIDASLSWILAILGEQSQVEATLNDLGELQRDTVSVAMVEGWRGEVVHCVETDKDGKLHHYQIQDPSLRNWFALAQVVRGGPISDFPVCNKSFDLSYCGHDL